MESSADSVHLLARLKALDRRIKRARVIVGDMERRLDRLRRVPGLRETALHSIWLSRDLLCTLEASRELYARRYLDALRCETELVSAPAALGCTTKRVSSR